MVSHVPPFYGPRIVALLAGVLDEAWQELVTNHDPRVLDHSLTRDDVAKRIMVSVLLGERNPSRLKVEAIAKAA